MAEARKLADAFLEQSPACHWIVDTSGFVVHVYGDPSGIFGRTAAEITGRTAAEALDAEKATAWTTRYSRVLQGETLRLREGHGGTVWHVSLFPIREDGEIRYIGGLAREAGAWATAEQELRHTVLGALRAMEFTRNMAARFLHDSVGQNLTALGLQLDLVRMDLEGVSPDLQSRVADVQKLLETMMEEVREYSYELNPSTVERAGLRSALDRLLVRIRSRFQGTVRMNVDPSLKIDPKLASAMYQIAQEAIENALQHSSCSSIEIAVKSSRTGIYLEVRDNGRGFDPADLDSARRGLGLLSMGHYAAEAGLELEIASGWETGTIIRASS
jgi:PAS domain S-box-containing protein